MADPETPRTGPTVAVHLGWRRSEDGIIAATWRSTRALQIPAELRAAVTAETSRTGRVLVPTPICEAFGRANESTRSAAKPPTRSSCHWRPG